MDLKEKALAILRFLSGEDKPEEIKDFSAVLADGVNVVVSPSLEVGATFSKLESDGTKTNFDDGVYELSETGELVSVADGKITDIKVKVDELEANLANELKLTNERFAELELKFNEVNDNFTKLTQERDAALAQVESQKEMIEEAKKLIVDLANLPSEVHEPQKPQSTVKLSAKEAAILKGELLLKIKQDKNK